MNSKTLLYIVCALIMTNCHKTGIAKSAEPANESIALFHTKLLVSDSAQITKLECEDFVSNALNNYTISNINKEYSNFLKCTKESVVNIHDHAVVDTIYTFSNAENEIRIYRAKQDDFVFTFDVTDSKLKLNGNIWSGMQKAVFFRKFNIAQTMNDKVQIGNSEGTMRFTFFFENNKLRRINSYLYLD